MLTQRLVLAAAALAAAAFSPAAPPQGPSPPHLQPRDAAVDLVVDGAPFLVLGGELGNSSGEPGYLERWWPRLRALNLNTVLAPVSWELVEPREGAFDFATVDGLLAGARAHDMRLVLLWFGSWKNSMSCYAPAWVKTDTRRFPRAADASGRSLDILSPFAAANREADARAFAALMRHLRETDGDRHTVVMVQVENEIGMIPEARDQERGGGRGVRRRRSRTTLLEYLRRHDDPLAPELRASWDGPRAAPAPARGDRCSGPAPQPRSSSRPGTSARYVEAVAAAGKAEYPLPMFVERRPHPPGLPSRAVSERRAASAPRRRLARRGAVARLPRARHLLPELRRVVPALRAPRQPALHPGGACVAVEASVHALYAVGRARRHRLRPLRHRVDPRAGGLVARRQLPPARGAGAHARSPTAGAARWPACCPR